MSSKEETLKVRCVTLNLKGLSNDWLGGRDQIVIQGIREYAPDVVCFQEAALRQSASIYHQAHEVGKACGLDFVAFSPYGNPLEIMCPEYGGIAVVARWPIVNVRNRRLPPGHDNPSDARVVLFVCLKAPSCTVQIANTHLSWHPKEISIRLLQMGFILDDLIRSECVSEHSRFILAGDLNAEPDEPAIQLAETSLLDTYRALHPNDPGYTWVSSNPLTRGYSQIDRRLDYIFCSKGAVVKRSDVIFTIPGKHYASDHFGLLAEIDWPNESPCFQVRDR